MMSLIATNNRKNIVAPQLYPEKLPENEVFLGKWLLFGKVVVSYMVPNFWHQERSLEASKTGPRLWSKTKTKTLHSKTKTEAKTLKLHLETSRDQDLSLETTSLLLTANLWNMAVSVTEWLTIRELDGHTESVQCSLSLRNILKRKIMQMCHLLLYI